MPLPREKKGSVFSVLLVLVAVVRQDGSPQVAVAADVDIGLVVPAGMLEEGGTEHRLKAVEVG